MTKEEMPEEGKEMNAGEMGEVIMEKTGSVPTPEEAAEQRKDSLKNDGWRHEK